jgi:CheY-like chemotaxis protein
MEKRVLIVDDDVGVVYTVKNGIEKMDSNYKITSVNSGDECLQKLANENKLPDLILLDIMMPGMSGWEVFKSLRENPSWEKIPVVFLTARTDNIAKNAGSFLGNDYIEKPFKLPELKERIDKILNEVK